MVENMLRNYSLLSSTSDAEYLDYRMDLDNAMSELKVQYPNLYSALMGVFVVGTPIQEQATLQKVSKMQVHRMLNDGLHMLTLIMNGEFSYEKA
jgi:CRISPR/Cas system-associated endonuclease Cas3-HD